MSAIENVAVGAYVRGHCGLIRSALYLNQAEERDFLFEAKHQLDEVGLGNSALFAAGSLPLGQQDSRKSPVPLPRTRYCCS